MQDHSTPTEIPKTPTEIANIQQPHFDYVPLTLAHSRYKDLGQRATNVLLETLTDPLTGLKNEKAFNMALDATIEAKNALPEAEGNEGQDSTMVLFRIDVDGFKGVNDALGHPVGDEVLETIAGAIKKSLRKDDNAHISHTEDKDPVLLRAGRDTEAEVENVQQELQDDLPELVNKSHAARPHGDEFDVLIADMLTRVDDPTLSMEQRIDTVKTHIRDVVNDAIGSSKYNGLLFELGVGVSIGAAVYKYGETRTDYLIRGDAAMYDDKSGKRTRMNETKASNTSQSA